MTKSQAFKYADPLIVAEMYATNANTQTLAPLKRFLKRHNALSKAVISMMVLYIIAADSEAKPKGQLPYKEPYYRKVQEEWLAMELLTPEAVLSYFKDAMEHVYQENKNPSVIKPMNTLPKTDVDPELDQALDNIYHNIR